MRAICTSDAPTRERLIGYLARLKFRPRKNTGPGTEKAEALKADLMNERKWRQLPLPAAQKCDPKSVQFSEDYKTPFATSR